MQPYDRNAVTLVASVRKVRAGGPRRHARIPMATAGRRRRWEARLEEASRIARAGRCWSCSVRAGGQIQHCGKCDCCRPLAERTDPTLDS